MHLRTISIAVWLGLAAAAASPVAVASAQSCCVCDGCQSCASATSGQGGAACAPTDPCFANPASPDACDAFCTAQDCDTSDVVAGPCSAVECSEQGVAAIGTKPAPALGSIGLALAAVAAGLGGVGRIVRRRRA
jgi:hypothetical protein